MMLKRASFGTYDYRIIGDNGQASRKALDENKLCGMVCLRRQGHTQEDGIGTSMGWFSRIHFCGFDGR